MIEYLAPKDLNASYIGFWINLKTIKNDSIHHVPNFKHFEPISEIGNYDVMVAINEKKNILSWASRDKFNLTKLLSL